MPEGNGQKEDYHSSVSDDESCGIAVKTGSCGTADSHDWSPAEKEDRTEIKNLFFKEFKKCAEIHTFLLFRQDESVKYV